MNRKWTKEDENFLIYYWGERPREWISKQLDRTVAACTKKMLKLTGTRSIKRGKYTQRQLAEECGFQYRQIRWAVEKLGLKVKQPRKKRENKAGKRKRPWDNSAWLISEEQAEQIIYWLTRPRWERTNTYECCTVCGSSEEDHKAKGVCRRCYSRIRQAEARRQKKAA